MRQQKQQELHKNATIMRNNSFSRKQKLNNYMIQTQSIYKKQLTQDKIKFLQDKTKVENYIIKRNSLSHDKILIQHLNAKEIKIKQQEQIRQMGKNNYENKLLQESEECINIVNAQKLLENREKDLFFKLKVTQNLEKYTKIQKQQVINQPIEQMLQQQNIQQ